MAAIPYTAPALVGGGSPTFFVPKAYYPAQAAAWRAGDILQMITTGTITTPNPNGAFATAAGPVGAPFQVVNASSTLTIGPVVLTATTSANAPATTYYVFLSYIGAGSIESLPGPEFVINAAAGFVPIIKVNSTGSPATSTKFAVYASVIQGNESQQSAATNLGSTYTLVNPLTNSIGINESVTNPNSNIVGIAQNNSTQQYVSGAGGSFLVGDNSLFGATMNNGPLSPGEEYLAYVFPLSNGQRFEISLKQAFWPALIGTTAGLLYDTATGFWVLDTTGSHTIATIDSQAVGVQTGTPGIPVTGQNGDTGARVVAYLTSGTF